MSVGGMKDNHNWKAKQLGVLSDALPAASPRPWSSLPAPAVQLGETPPAPSSEHLLPWHLEERPEQSPEFGSNPGCRTSKLCKLNRC